MALTDLLQNRFTRIIGTLAALALPAGLACEADEGSQVYPPSSQPTSQPCYSDSECKGERICVSGYCQDSSGANGSYNQNGNGVNNNNNNPVINPEARDICDQKDNNANGLIDELGCGKIYVTYSDDTKLTFFDLSTLEETMIFSSSSIGIIYPNDSEVNPYNKSIAFSVNGGLYSLGLTNTSLIVAGNEKNCFGPSWNTSNDSLVCYTWWDGPLIYSFDFYDLEESSIFTFPEKVEIVDIAVSPNGQKIAFSAPPFDDFKEEVYLVNSNGSNLEQLTSGAKSHSLDWKGNERIFYSCSEGICSVSPSGSDQKTEFAGYSHLVFNQNYTKAILQAPESPTLVWDLNTSETFDLDVFDYNSATFGWTN